MKIDEVAPAVVVVRDPDCSNDISLYGLPDHTRVFDVDLGAMCLQDPGECVEWAHSLLMQVNLSAPAPADEQVLELVREFLGRHRVQATFTPQVWVNDVAIEVDPQGAVSWDVTGDFWLQSDTEIRDQLGEILASGVAYDGLDFFHQAGDQPEWAWGWSGPFYIVIEVV